MKTRPTFSPLKHLATFPILTIRTNMPTDYSTKSMLGTLRVEQQAFSLATTGCLSAASQLILILLSQRYNLDVHNVIVLVTHLMPPCDMKPWGFVASEVCNRETLGASQKRPKRMIRGQSWNDLLLSMIVETGFDMNGSAICDRSSLPVGEIGCGSVPHKVCNWHY